MTKFRNWWLGLPYPLWLLSACRPRSPWCLIDDLAHRWFPQTYGWSDYSGEFAIENWPDEQCWICVRHDKSAERWNRKHHPEDFDD